MRTLITLTIAVALLVTVVPVTAQNAADEAAILKLVEQEFATFNKHDAKALAALFTEDNENWTGRQKGRAGQEKGFLENFERQKDIQWNLLDEISLVFVTPDVAIYKAHSEDIGRVDKERKLLPPRKLLSAWVCVKKNGKWLEAAYFERPIEE